MNYEQHIETCHVLHLLMTLLTCGLWVVVWVMCAIINDSANEAIDKRNQMKEAQYLAMTRKGMIR